MHDGSWIVLKKLSGDYDPTDRNLAYKTLDEARREQKFLTGLFYIDETQPDMCELLDMVDTPLSQLPESKLRPDREELDKIMASL